MRSVYTMTAALVLVLVLLTSGFSQERRGGGKGKRRIPSNAGNLSAGTYGNVGPDINGIKQRGRNRRNNPKGFYIDDIIIGIKHPGNRTRKRGRGL